MAQRVSRFGVSWIAILAVLPPIAGCSGDDAPIVEPGHVVFASNCVNTSLAELPPVSVPQASSMIVHVINDGDTAVSLGFMFGRGSSEIRITGPDADDFSLLSADSEGDCLFTSEVLPGGWCQLALSFHPEEAGTKRASVEIGGAGSLAISGAATATVRTLTADLANLAFAYIAPNLPTGILVRNDGSSPAVLGDPVVDPPFIVRRTQCPAILTPGGACTIDVGIPERSQLPDACLSGNLSTTSTDLRIPLTYTPSRLFPVGLGIRLVGDGEGRVISSDGTIDCAAPSDAGCGHRYAIIPTSVDLTAEASSGSVFVGWVEQRNSTFLACGAATSCAISLPTASTRMPEARSVIAWFAPMTYKRITVTIVGTGSVLAPGLVRCDSSCSFTVPPGGNFGLTQETAGTFSGWSGDCSGTECQLGVILNDRNVTATFSP